MDDFVDCHSIKNPENAIQSTDSMIIKHLKVLIDIDAYKKNATDYAQCAHAIEY